MTEDILTAEDKTAIKQALKDSEKLRKEIQRAKRAGLDVTDMDKRLNDAEVALRNIYNVYIARET